MFNWQIKVQQQQMAILDEEERLIRTQMEAITNQIKGKVIYFYIVIFCIFIIFNLSSFTLHYEYLHYLMQVRFTCTGKSTCVCQHEYTV